jgi:predicted CXXCH cytochrome family protein
VNWHRTAAIAVVPAAAICAALLLNSCSSVAPTVFAPPEIPGAHYVGNRACGDCHANYVRAFSSSPHARIHFARAEFSGQSGCESCHGPGSKHIEAGGGRRFITNPGKDPTACFNCHLETRAEFNLPQHHPVIEGHMNCVQCHDPHGMNIFKPAGGLAMARLNESCAQCHREQTRPVVFEHEAMREGCATCHNPHGSVNRKMLTDADSNLCLRCHAQNQGILAGTGAIYIGSVDHTTYLNRATCWAAGCHTAVHGSNVDPRLRY